MNEHQQNSNHTCQPMNIEEVCIGHLHHDSGPGCITKKPCPKEKQVPAFQSTRQALAPYADGVKHQCQGNQYYRREHLYRHDVTLRYIQADECSKGAILVVS